MFRVDSLIRVVVTLAVGLSLGACSSSSTNFDPTDWISADMFSKKEPLPGERKLVFPEGVPGVAEGVPKELVKGNQQQAAVDAGETPAAQPAPAVKPAPKPQAARPAPKPRTASAPAQSAPARTTPPPQQKQASQPAAATAWPDPTTVQTPTRSRPAAPPVSSAPPNSEANWPPPDPNTFSR